MAEAKWEFLFGSCHVCRSISLGLFLKFIRVRSHTEPFVGHYLSSRARYQSTLTSKEHRHFEISGQSRYRENHPHIFHLYHPYRIIFPIDRLLCRIQSLIIIKSRSLVRITFSEKNPFTIESQLDNGQRIKKFGRQLGGACDTKSIQFIPKWVAKNV